MEKYSAALIGGKWLFSGVAISVLLCKAGRCEIHTHIGRAVEIYVCGINVRLGRGGQWRPDCIRLSRTQASMPKMFAVLRTCF
eukprot:191443-Chlamydomonas_euryale.AAC.9